MPDMTELEKLLATQQIAELQARRCLAVDTKDWETYEALHAPEHTSFNDGEQKWVGAKANTERVANALSDKVTMHHVHAPIISFESPTKASGIWSMEDSLWWQEGDREHWLHGMGFYHETYEKRSGKWLFTSRKLKRQKVTSSPGATFGKPAAPSR